MHLIETFRLNLVAKSYMNGFEPSSHGHMAEMEAVIDGFLQGIMVVQAIEMVAGGKFFPLEPLTWRAYRWLHAGIPHLSLVRLTNVDFCIYLTNTMRTVPYALEKGKLVECWYARGRKGFLRQAAGQELLLVYHHPVVESGSEKSAWTLLAALHRLIRT